MRDTAAAISWKEEDVGGSALLPASGVAVRCFLNEYSSEFWMGHPYKGGFGGGDSAFALATCSF